MPYKSLEAKRARARQYGKEYFQRKKGDPAFGEDRIRRRREWGVKNKPYEQEYRRKYWLEHKQDPDWLAKHREKQRFFGKMFREQLRQEILTQYGGRCECCGETEPAFLTIDHIQGGGHDDFKGRSPSAVYKRMIAENDRAKYRVLCWNCNMGREKQGGICPHKLRTKKEKINGAVLGRSEFE